MLDLVDLPLRMMFEVQRPPTISSIPSWLCVT